VFKKGSPSDPSNYRPISLTCISCKLLESVIKESLLCHLLQHNIINKHQHGFLRRKSTATQLLECNLDWNIALNSRNSIDIIYLDYAKAFDSVVHQKLLAKLSCYGINGQLLTWIKSFLTGRTQYVIIAGSYSHTCCVISGVPQGSVLGPVLFIVFVNDICKVVCDGVTVKLFADDTKLYSVINTAADHDNLQSCLSAIYNWSAHWQLTLSPSKCSVLHVSPTQASNYRFCNYYVNDAVLPSVDCVTDLGVSYDNKLRCAPHIDKIVSRASLRSKLILNCFQSRNPSLLIRAFCTFVRPTLEYCSVVWSPGFKKDISRIEAVQRRFTKRLAGLRNMPYCDRLNYLNLDSLTNRRVKSDLLMCYKILHGYVDVDISSFFARVTGGVTRGNDMKLYKSRLYSVRDGNFFCNRVINVWNSLPSDVVNASSVGIFKRRLRCFRLPEYH